MKKTVFSITGLVVCYFLFTGTVNANGLDCNLSFVQPLQGIDGDTSGWSTGDNVVNLGTSNWSLLSGTATVNGYRNGDPGVLTHRGTRGLGVKGGEYDEVDTIDKLERIEITFNTIYMVSFIEVRSLFYNDAGWHGTEEGQIDFYLRGYQTHSEHLIGVEDFYQSGTKGIVNITYTPALIIDKIVFYVPQGEPYTDESEFAVAKLCVEPAPCPTKVWVDDDWNNQSDVNTYDPALIWQYNAFNTIQDAIDAVCPHGIVYVLPGVYQENAHPWVDIDVYKPVSIIGSGVLESIVELHEYDNPSGTHMDGVSISASDVLIQGLKFTRQPGASYASEFNIRAGVNVHTPPSDNIFSNITLKNIESEYSHGMNVVFDGGYTYIDINIINCSIHHSYTERCFYQPPSVTIHNLNVINSSFNYAGYGGPTVWGDPRGFNLQGTTVNLTIIGGTFNHDPGAGISIGSYSPTGSTTNAVIKDVYVEDSGWFDPGRAGIEILDNATNITILNPTVIGCGGRGILFVADTAWGSPLNYKVTDCSLIGGTIEDSENVGVMIAAGGTDALIQNVLVNGVNITGSDAHNILVLEYDDVGDATCVDITITHCNITEATEKGVYFYGCDDLTGSHVNYNNIVNNLDGIYNTLGNGILDAECNWYGHQSGPTHPSNPLGFGDTVSDNVDYTPWLNAPYPLGECIGGLCQDIVWVDEDYHPGTPGFNIDHFPTIQSGVDRVCPGGTVYVYNGTYPENVVVNVSDVLLTAVYPPPFLIKEETAATLDGTITVNKSGFTLTNFAILPSVDTAAVKIREHVDAGSVTIHHNKFLRNCESDALGVENKNPCVPVDARFNWWGAPNGPSGEVTDPVTGRKADGYGVGIVDNGLVKFDPWAGVHAEATASKTEVETGEVVHFDATKSFAYHLDGTINSYSVYWDFDDGFYSFDKQTTHRYNTAGIYHVSLRVRASDTNLETGFMYDWDYVTIVVTQPDEPLHADADAGSLGTYETIVGEPVQLYGSAYGGTPPYTYHWNFGDDATSNEQNPVHIYTNEGVYTATLTVVDSEGDTATDTATVLVHSIEDLMVRITAPSNAVAGVTMQFQSTVTGGTPPYTYQWSFGDGTTSSSKNPVHIYDNEGIYTVTLTITDNHGIFASDTVTITVAPQENVEHNAAVEIKEIKGGFGITVTIAANDEPVEWSIIIKDALLGGEAEGTIPADSEETVRTPLLTLGFGNLNVIITANEIEKHYRVLMVGPLALNLKPL